MKDTQSNLNNHLKQKKKAASISPQNHPWKLASFKQFLHKIGKSYEEFQAEKNTTSQLLL